MSIASGAPTQSVRASANAAMTRLLGAARVVGPAGSPAKVEAVTARHGFDAALNHKDALVHEQLPQLVPDGVDAYFDSVGGDHLECALTVVDSAAGCGYLRNRQLRGHQ